jgi:hypothetical protein
MASRSKPATTEKICLRCRKPFQSEDVKYNRLCANCNKYNLRECVKYNIKVNNDGRVTKKEITPT